MNRYLYTFNNEYLIIIAISYEEAHLKIIEKFPETSWFWKYEGQIIK